MIISAVFEAFQDPYVPGFPAALLEILDRYDKVGIYDRAVAIVQSSGMGKSRGIEETARSRFTFLFNLRRNIHPSFGMQPRTPLGINSHTNSISSP